MQSTRAWLFTFAAVGLYACGSQNKYSERPQDTTGQGATPAPAQQQPNQGLEGAPPGQTEPGAPEPGMAAPDSNAPGAASGSMAPGTAAPGSPAPGMKAPAPTSPEAMAPGTTHPGMTEPEKTAPGMAEPGSATPSIPGQGGEARAKLTGPTGAEVGMVVVRSSDNGTVVHLESAGMREGEYAVLIHENGKCTGINFSGAGDAKAPAGESKVVLTERKAEMFEVGPDGTVIKDITLTGYQLQGDPSTARGDGAAVIVYRKTDAQKGTEMIAFEQYGERVACAVISPR